MSNNFLDPDAQFQDNEEMNEDTLVFDLGEVDEEAAEFQPLPAGVYNCIVENAEYKTSSTGNLMIGWVFKVIDPEHEGRLFFYHTVLNKDSGKSRLKRLLIRVVPDFPMGQFRPKAFCDEGHALGMPCRVKVRIRKYQGKPVNDVTDVLAPQETGGFLDQ